MFPSYRGYMPSVDLGPEDIRKVTGISYTSFGPLTNGLFVKVQSLYGKPRGANVRGEQVAISISLLI